MTKTSFTAILAILLTLILNTSPRAGDNPQRTPLPPPPPLPEHEPGTGASGDEPSLKGQLPIRDKEDSDQIPNDVDPDIDDDGLFNWDPLENDIDGDGAPNGSDSDSDGDGLRDSDDPSPLGPEPRTHQLVEFEFGHPYSSFGGISTSHGNPYYSSSSIANDTTLRLMLPRDGMIQFSATFNDGTIPIKNLPKDIDLKLQFFDYSSSSRSWRPVDGFRGFLPYEFGYTQGGETELKQPETLVVNLEPIEFESTGRLLAGSIDERVIDALGGASSVGLEFRNPSSGERYRHNPISSADVHDQSHASTEEGEDTFLSNEKLALAMSESDGQGPLSSDAVFYRQFGRLHFRAWFDRSGKIEIGFLKNGRELGIIRHTLAEDEGDQ